MGAPARWRLPLAPVRGWGAVPRPVVAALAGTLAAQVAWQVTGPEPRTRIEALPPPPPVAVLRAAALGEPRTASALGVLWLQFHDTQPGLSVPFAELDYDRLRAWLERLLALAPASEYPLLLAVRVYAQVNDPARRRIMLEFVRDAFVERPADRWRWLAEATIIAKHRLRDLELALEYAELLRERTEPGGPPFWARDLHFLVLEDMGELEAARILIGGMLASGEIDDPNELQFLEDRLQMLQDRAAGGE